MARLAIFSHAPSDSVNALKAHLSIEGVDLIKIKRENSRFLGRDGDLIINYGSSAFPMQRVGRGRLLNNPEAVGLSSNKLRAFQRFEQAGVKTVEWTADYAQAATWVREGGMVYARTSLQGHSGAGIVIGYGNPAGVGDAGDVQVVSTLPRAQLYTKAILQERREFRIHVMNGVITYVQQKRRRDGFRENENYSNLVRNHHTGWIYATQNADVCDEAKREAVKAIEALGLDFGAVDVITRRGEAWVLEVNTAPGMSGTNLETYATNFQRILNGQALEGEVVDMSIPAERGGELDAMVAHQQEQRNDNSNTRNDSNSRRRNTQPQQSERESSPANTQEPTTTPTPVSTRAPAAPTEAPVSSTTTRDANGTPLTNNGVYKLVVDGNETVGKFEASCDHFEILGWEVPVEREDATIGERLCTLN